MPRYDVERVQSWRNAGVFKLYRTLNFSPSSLAEEGQITAFTIFRLYRLEILKCVASICGAKAEQGPTEKLAKWASRVSVKASGFLFCIGPTSDSPLVRRSRTPSVVRVSQEWRSHAKGNDFDYC